jgi:hypothetical protein
MPTRIERRTDIRSLGAHEFSDAEGRYTLVLIAPGHQQYAQRILVPDAPLEIDAKLVPEN